MRNIYQLHVNLSIYTRVKTRIAKLQHYFALEKIKINFVNEKEVRMKNP